MDQTRFDRLTQTIAAGAPRRALLASLAGGILLASGRQPVAADHKAGHENQGQGPKCKHPCTTALQAQIDELREQLGTVPDTGDLQRQVNQLQTQVTQLQTQLDQTRGQLETQVLILRNYTVHNLNRIEGCLEQGNIQCPGSSNF
jgi:peptidoglycan hydrolase CwlO-like protein